MWANLQATRFFRNYLRVNHSKHMFVAECGILFWRTGLPNGKILDRLDSWVFGMLGVRTNHLPTGVPRGNIILLTKLYIGTISLVLV